jgi:predicted AAA+ superfamily ATPase
MKVEIKRLFREYLELGGFPKVLKIGDTTLLKQYYRDSISLWKWLLKIDSKVTPDYVCMT